MYDYDAVIIGAGHNGLVAASYLAKGGYQVCIVEARPVVGGACVTEEFYPGFHVSSASDIFGWLQPHIIEDLQLDQYGLEVYSANPQLFLPFPDGNHLTIWLDTDATTREIEKFSEEDAKAFLEFGWFTYQVSGVLESMFIHHVPTIPEVWTSLETFVGPGSFRKVCLLSIEELLDLYFESEQVKAALMLQALIVRNAGPRSPNTALNYFYNSAHQVNGRRLTAGFAKGGMGSVTQAMARSAEERGVEIITEARVERILIKAGMAYGVRLTGGEEITSRIVLSNADPQSTFLDMVRSDELPVDFRKSVYSIELAGVSSKIHLALSEPPDFRAWPGKSVGPQHSGFIAICPSVEYAHNAWVCATLGRPADYPVLNMTIQSATDPSLAPPGYHVASIYVHYTPYHLVSGSWDTVKEDYADLVIDMLASYTPNIKDAIVAREILSPVDLETRFGLRQGGGDHGEMSLQQMFGYRPVAGWSRYETPINNLYLCGAGTYPGGGVSGIPGYNCAQAILGGFGQRSKAIEQFRLKRLIDELVTRFPNARLAELGRRVLDRGSRIKKMWD